MIMSEIPSVLIEQFRQGRIILLLGAGSSLEAKNSDGRPMPSGKQLAKEISDKFLGGDFNDSELNVVSEYAISESGLLQFQAFIADRLRSYLPTPAHRMLPKFLWGGIATTNYDILIERAYQEAVGGLQIPVPIVENGDQILPLMRDPRAVKLLKLHGCINRVANEQCPLILTKDQYTAYRNGRSRLFDQLHEWAYEHTIVFVGHRVEDPNLREVIFELDQRVETRPRYYLVAPDFAPIQARFWEQKRVTVLNHSLESFLAAIDSSLEGELRGLVVSIPQDGGISRHFRVANIALSRNAREFLTSDAAYVESCVASKTVAPLDFYKGYNAEWAPIEQNLDIRRAFADDILEDIFLRDSLTSRGRLEVILIKGYAGCGKTVAMRRIAWEAAKVYNCLCIYAKDIGKINVGAIQEIIDVCNERVFLFIDNASERAKEISELINEIGKFGELLTVIVSSRGNEWNGMPKNVQAALTSEYEVPTLSKKEIVSLLEKLEMHNALDQLQFKSLEQRIQAFDGIAGRQLLVALYEATHGYPLEDILENEYKRIIPAEAQELYLTVCVLYRLGIPVRAGLVSRIHGLPFSEFKERLFKPLEHVVYDTYDERIRDNVYTARHPIIAEIVFDRLLRDQNKRFDAIFRCLRALIVDYSTDERAFREIVKGRTLLKLFSNVEYCRAIFEQAASMVGDEPHLLQQRALYEMHRGGGNLGLASTLIAKAIEKQPYNKALKHTKAELALKKVKDARSPLEKEKLYREATSLALETRDARSGEVHAYHTLVKVYLKRLEDSLSVNGKDFSKPSLQEIIRQVESTILEGLQAKPGDAYLLGERAKYARLINDQEMVLKSLEKAVAENGKLTFLVIQLANCYENSGEIEKACSAVAKALELKRSDKNLNYSYTLLLEKKGAKHSELCYYLKRSFTPGDTNYDAQLRYARSLFLSGEYEEAKKEFRKLSENRGAPYVAGELLYEAGEIFSGVILSIRHSHIWVRENDSTQHVYIPKCNVEGDQWMQFTEGARVRFKIAFNVRGPIGNKCELI